MKGLLVKNKKLYGHQRKLDIAQFGNNWENIKVIFVIYCWFFVLFEQSFCFTGILTSCFLLKQYKFHFPKVYELSDSSLRRDPLYLKLRQEVNDILGWAGRSELCVFLKNTFKKIHACS